jgi:glycosyltransferase involved in cell wall biosynthesis
MKIAYLIDRNTIGGGMEYIRRQMSVRSNDECQMFVADRGECSASKLNKWCADIIHVNHLKALVQLFRNPFVRPRGKIVFTVHGIHLRKFDFLPKTTMNRVKRFLRLSLERYLYGKCDELIALTETDAADIRRLYGETLPIVIEPNFIDESSLRSPEGLRYKRDEFAFVCIARFDFPKGQDILLSAIVKAQDKLRMAQMKTLFIGGGENMDVSKKYATHFGVSDLVEFAGEIPNAGVYMMCGKTLVAPSRWEGMPYILLEAVARKRHIIASDCPGNRDVLIGYNNADMFPVEDSDVLAKLMEAGVA